MMFLTRGATYPGLPQEFAYPAAFGDLITAIIAFAAIPLVLRGSSFAKPTVWIFNIFGTADLLNTQDVELMAGGKMPKTVEQKLDQTLDVCVKRMFSSDKQ